MHTHMGQQQQGQISDGKKNHTLSHTHSIFPMPSLNGSYRQSNMIDNPGNAIRGVQLLLAE